MTQYGKIKKDNKLTTMTNLPIYTSTAGQHIENPKGLWCLFSRISFVLWLLEEVCGSWGTSWVYWKSCWGLWTGSSRCDLFCGYLVALLHICHKHIWRSRYNQKVIAFLLSIIIVVIHRRSWLLELLVVTRIW